MSLSDTYKRATNRASMRLVAASEESDEDRGHFWSEVAPALAEEFRAQAPELAAAMAERVREALPELLADPDDNEANRTSNEATIRAMADLLERGADPYEATLPEATRVWAGDMAKRGRSLPGLMRIYRVSHAIAWDWVLPRLRESSADQDQLAEAVELMSDWMLSYVDALVVLAEDAYGNERERWLRGSSAIRLETINAILSGEPVDPSTASRRLGYELDRTHVALVAWRSDGDEGLGSFAELEATIRKVASPLAGGEPLVLPTGVLTAAAWFGVDGDLAEDALDGAEVDPDNGILLAVGYPAEGVEGFCRSHQEALAARRVAILGGRPAGTVLPYAEVALAANATRGETADAWRFVRRQLGPLAAEGESSLRLLETLRVYLAQGGSHGRAAARLGIHENTVRYRVRQCEDRLGRMIGPEDFDLQAALVLTEAIPALAGEAPPTSADPA